MNQPTPPSEKTPLNPTAHTRAAKNFLDFIGPERPLTDTQQTLLAYFNDVKDELPVLTLPEELFPDGIPQQPTEAPPANKEKRRRQNLPSSLGLRYLVAVLIFCSGYMMAEIRPLLSAPPTIALRPPTAPALQVAPLQFVEVPNASCPVAGAVATKKPPQNKKGKSLAKRPNSKKGARAKNRNSFPPLPPFDSLIDTSGKDLFSLSE